MNEEIITIKTSMFPAEVIVLKFRLEEEGISCFLNDDNIVSVHPLISSAVGGVKVNIKKSDLNKALDVINQLENERKIVNEKWEKEYYHVDKFCPKCESFLVYTKKHSVIKSVINILFFPLYLIIQTFTKKQFYCANCNVKWKQ